jgi:hypothetical protein
MPSPMVERSPTDPSEEESHGFGIKLSPVKFSAQNH